MKKGALTSFLHWICICITLIVLCASVSGCEDSAIVWSSQVQSPDGRWIATAETKQYGGPGTAGIVTTVYLAQANARDDRRVVLAYSQETLSRTPQEDLKMSWLNNSNFEVTYRGPHEFDFQAIKCAGITILVRKKA